ncbi:O-antigen ligase family protein [uncultured Microbacterium sp.]|uniref:O-antigen ligase family protein n=1 Tax=uncultured Microbacterium sp. TaxID=191216 RepID=UPI0025F03E1C|nr:O-antigen ligase family protein [uncultured Microbacterium sp.]
MTTSLTASRHAARSRSRARTRADDRVETRRRRLQLATVLVLGAWWGTGGSLVNLVIAGRLPADRMSTGRIADTVLGSQVQNLGMIACIVGCLAIAGWNLLTRSELVRPAAPLLATFALFASVSFANLVASGQEVRSGSRIALLLALTIWVLQPRVGDLRLIGVAGLVIVAVSLALLPSGKTWMPAADIVLQEKALIGTQLMAGPFGQSNVLGLALAVCAPFVFLFRRVVVRLASFGVIGWFLILSGSRSALIGLAMAVTVALVILVVRNRLFSGVVAAVAVVVFVCASLWLPLTTNDPQAFTQRGSIWMISRATWASDSALLFGNGLSYYGIGGRFAVFEHGSPTYHGHNELLSVMTTSGVVATTALLAIFATALVGALRMSGRGRRTMFLVVLVLLGSGIAETPLRIDTVDSLGWLTWFALFAVTVATTREARETGQSEGAPLTRSRSRAR